VVVGGQEQMSTPFLCTSNVSVSHHTARCFPPRFRAPYRAAKYRGIANNTLDVSGLLQQLLLLMWRWRFGLHSLGEVQPHGYMLSNVLATRWM
jgi:hypothetical protein